MPSQSKLGLKPWPNWATLSGNIHKFLMLLKYCQVWPPCRLTNSSRNLLLKCLNMLKHFSATFVSLLFSIVARSESSFTLTARGAVSSSGGGSSSFAFAIVFFITNRWPFLFLIFFFKASCSAICLSKSQRHGTIMRGIKWMTLRCTNASSL